MLLSGESLASQFSCCILSAHAMQANIKPTLVTISICMEVLTNVEGKKNQEHINVCYKW